MRVERGSALLAMLYANTHGKERFDIHDFMPHQEAPPIDLETAMKTWG